jgi:uncharacterized protein with PIN domain
MDEKENRTIWIRVYAELNERLPSEYRFTDFPCFPEGQPTIGDIIRDAGIPLTEVDLILVNGESVDFSYRPRHTDRLSVYPVFESFDISQLTRVRPKPLRVSKFVLDVHLGKLAYYLRMLGFDSLYRNDFNDEELLSLSVNEGRILLSKDRELLTDDRLQRCYYVCEKHPRKQVAEVMKRFDLFRACSPLQRCIRCNVLLESADKQDVLDRLPARIAVAFQEFRHCPSCGRVYWKGSHYERMMAFVEDILSTHTLQSNHFIS